MLWWVFDSGLGDHKMFLMVFIGEIFGMSVKCLRYLWLELGLGIILRLNYSLD